MRGDVLAIDCQSNLLSDLPTRFVVPLRLVDIIAPKRLVPTFLIEGVTLTMVTHFARAISIREIEETVTNFDAAHLRIKAALDMLISGY